MEGVTGPAMRQLLSEYGSIGLVCTEFVRVHGDGASPARLARHVDKASGVALSVQVMGNDPELMAEAGQIVAAAGADVVDVNLGCPSRNAAKKGVGAGLLREPERLNSLLVAMRRALPGLFSAKLRAGFDDASGALDHARMVESAGADFLTVHPRRRVDFYRGTADWRIIATLRRELGIPVIGNGDVWYASDALRMLEETRCDAIMIGRPALRNPWIFRQIGELCAGRQPFSPSGADVAAHFRRVHARLAEGRQGAAEARLIGPLKEQLSFACRALPDGLSVRRRLSIADSTARLLEAIDEAFTPLPAEALDLDAFGKLRLEQSGSALQSAA